jgi:hypothetical protein
VDRRISLAHVLALVGGLGLVAAFFMPWFSSQGLLLSGQFLHNFLASANQTDLRRFLPNASPTEVQTLRLLVDTFPVAGALAALAALLGGLVNKARLISNVALGATGLIALAGWAGGITRLPSGANAETGLYLMAASAVAILLGLAFSLVSPTVD